MATSVSEQEKTAYVQPAIKTESLPKDKRVFDGPVGWLLGKQLLGSLKGILLYTAYGKKLDPRDWMWANVFPPLRQTDVLEFWRSQGQSGSAPASPSEISDGQDSEFWFDYIADTGDGSKATYSIAYLCLSDLYVKGGPDLAGVETKVRTGTQQKPGDGLLPRGKFLFIGGDTAYHTSDYMTLASRVQQPFQWAYEDLVDDKARDKNAPNRPVFGIPGNHDYYDQLDGFRRQFRRPVRPEPGQGLMPAARTDEERGNQPQLYLPGFARYQEASYIALRLPFDWWLWGLDTEVGQIDERQQKFFLGLCQRHEKDPEIVVPPNKLIVATCAPTTVFGKLADPEDKKSADAFGQLGIAQPFLPDQVGGKLNTAGDSKLLPGQCRLDLSGDVHHYARYWGPKTGDSPRANARAEAPSAESYASVVSGIGGAFHHPSATYLDEVQEQRLYPSEETSTRAIAQRIFKFWNIWNGGYVFLAGAIMALIVYFAATTPISSRQAINNLGAIKWLGLATGGSQATVYFYGECCLEWTVSSMTGAAFLLASILPLLFPLISKRLFKTDVKSRERLSTPYGQGIKPRMDDPEISAEPENKLWTLVIASALLFIGGGLLLYPQRVKLSPFGGSMIVTWSLLWAAAALALSFRFSEFLFKKAHRVCVRSVDWALTWVLTGLAIVCSGLSLWLFGKYNLPALLITDMVFLLLLGGAFLGLILLPALVGGELFRPHDNLVVYTGRVLVGLWHFVLQIATAFVLVRKGNSLTWAAAAALILAMSWVGQQLLAKKRRKLLAFVWVGYGAGILALPYLLEWLFGLPEPFLHTRWDSWWGLVPAAIAGLWGAVLSCVWFGWYLGVCFAFNGHNNEVGGAARLEEYKQFIRFRLTEDRLIGYVIAVDQPQDYNERECLKARIVDVIELKVKQ